MPIKRMRKERHSITVILIVASIMAVFSTAFTANAQDFNPVYPLDNEFTVTCINYYKDGTVHSSYGYGDSSNTIDIGAPITTKVYAIEGGTVTYAGWDSTGYGNKVVIQHFNGEKSLYAHFSEIYVKYGQQVSRGQNIALSGNTGRSNGPHLHFAYSGGNLFKDVYLPIYYDRFEFEKNVRRNNDIYNSDKWIVNLIDSCYYLSGDYYYPCF